MAITRTSGFDSNINSINNINNTYTTETTNNSSASKDFIGTVSMIFDISFMLGVDHTALDG
eukprot:3070840-Heterocapsa_arctica.AAC.1